MATSSITEIREIDKQQASQAVEQVETGSAMPAAVPEEQGIPGLAIPEWLNLPKVKPQLNNAPEWKCWKRVRGSASIARGIDEIPVNVALVPVQGKQPFRKGWQTEAPVPRELIKEEILKGIPAISKKGNEYQRYASGYGIRTGNPSNGLICIDIDGESALPILLAMSGGDLPLTPAWTSGKKGRGQIVYQIPPEHLETLSNFTRVALTEWQGLETRFEIQPDGKKKYFDLLEIRYNRCQSVLPMSYHPDTGEYYWIQSMASTPIAIAPQWLCDLVVRWATEQRDKKGKEFKGQIDYDRLRELRGDGDTQNNGAANNLVDFLNYEVLPLLSVEQIYNGNHNFQQFGETLKGSPTWRASASGTSLHVWWDGTHWAWQDKATQEGGGAVRYRWKIKGGSGAPCGRDFVEIVRELASDAGLELPTFERRDVSTGDQPGADAESTSDDGWMAEYDEKVEKEQKRLNTFVPGEKCNIIDVHTKFLSQDKTLLSKIKPGYINVLLSGMGGGKTTTIQDLVNLHPDARVISLPPTQTLGKMQAAVLDAIWHEEVSSVFEKGYGSISKADMIKYNYKKIVLCAPSLHYAAPFNCFDELEVIPCENLILVLDEFREFVEFLLTSELCNHPDKNGTGSRAHNVAAFKEIFKNLKQNNVTVIVADANITNAEIDFLKAISGVGDVGVNVIKHHVPRPSWDVIVHSDRASVESKIVPLLTDGIRLVIPCDSQERAESLDEELSKKGFAVLRIDKQSLGHVSPTIASHPQYVAGSNPAQDFVIPEKMNETLARYMPDVLIYSPSLGSGASVTFTCEMAAAYKSLFVAKASGDEKAIALALEQVEIAEKDWETGTPYFGHRIGLNSHLPPSMFRQMLARARHPLPTDIYCGQDLPISGCKSPLPDEQLRQLLRHAEGLQLIHGAALAGGEDTLEIGQRIRDMCRAAAEGLSPECSLYAAIRARSAYNSRSRLHKLSRELRIDGHNITIRLEEKQHKLADEMEADGFTVIQKDGAGGEFSSDISEITDRRRMKKAAGIVSAPLITKEKFQEIDKKSSPSTAEEFEKSRYIFEQKYPGFLDALPESDRADFYYFGILKDRSHWLNSVRNYWDYCNRDRVLPLDIFELERLIPNLKRAESCTLQDLRKLRSGFYDFVARWGCFDIVRLDDFDKEYTRADLEELLVRSKKLKVPLKTYFDTAPPDPKKLVSWFSRILQNFNRKMVLARVEKQKGNNIRYYKIMLNNPVPDPENPNKNADWASESNLNLILQSLEIKNASKLDTVRVRVGSVISWDIYTPQEVTDPTQRPAVSGFEADRHVETKNPDYLDENDRNFEYPEIPADDLVDGLDFTGEAWDAKENDPEMGNWEALSDDFEDPELTPVYFCEKDLRASLLWGIQVAIAAYYEWKSKDFAVVKKVFAWNEELREQYYQIITKLKAGSKSNEEATDQLQYSFASPEDAINAIDSIVDKHNGSFGIPEQGFSWRRRFERAWLFSQDFAKAMYIALTDSQRVAAWNEISPQTQADYESLFT